MVIAIDAAVVVLIDNNIIVEIDLNNSNIVLAIEIEIYIHTHYFVKYIF